MRSAGGWGLAAVLLAAVVALASSHASASPTGSVTVKWQGQALVRVALTPNYASNFGQIPAVIGTQPAPTHGPDAVLDGGSVDFGNVLAGKNYVYHYAVHLNVLSNSTTGLNVYGEGAADFFNTADSSTIPLASAVYWLPSTSGGSDSNTGFSPGTPFEKTTGIVTNNGQFTTPSIAYTTYPSPISSTTLANADFYYDYQLKVPYTATSGLYYVWIVYTVVAK